jgi:ribosomal protein S14
MRKLQKKDEKIRKKVKNFEKKKFVLKTILSNLNLANLLRFNALNKTNKIQKKTSKTFISNLCINTINKKKFTKFSKFSRIVFLKLARSKKIFGLSEASW